MLEGGDEIDMPIFFFIDPEFSTDPWMKDVDEITLHYTFFKSILLLIIGKKQDI